MPFSGDENDVARLREGDCVDVRTPHGKETIEVLRIRYGDGAPERALLTQATDFMGPALQRTFSALGAEVVADAQPLADVDDVPITDTVPARERADVNPIAKGDLGERLAGAAALGIEFPSVHGSVRRDG